MRIACLNQDRGIAPGMKKGAAIHLVAMRRAFEALGTVVVAVDESDPQAARARLEESHAEEPLDLVYERYALGATTGARFASIPLVLEVNAPLAEEEERWRGRSTSDPEAERFVFEHAESVLAVSSEVARYSIDRGASPERVHVLGNGVDLERFQPRKERDPLRGSLVPEGRFALGFHGRLRPWHAFDRLVSATRELLMRGAPIHLVLVGEGAFERSLAGQIPQDRVTRIPWVEPEHVGSYVAAFDALPLTYASDAPCYFSPLKLTEAMACGVVPIVPDLGDLPMSVTDGVDGLVYGGRRASSLADAVWRLIEQPELHRRLSRSAIRTAEGRTWAQVAARVLMLMPKRLGR